MNKILLLVIIATLALSACTTTPTLKQYGGNSEEMIERTPTNLDEFAQCLSENDATMYGADWCPHCNDQKKLFGDSFAFVNYVECEENPKICNGANIRGYPTWIVKGQFLEGGKSFEQLSTLTGCELPVEI